MVEVWRGWDLDKPPVEGAIATERGWEIPLKGTDPSKELSEVIVAIRELNTKAGGADIVAINIVNDPGFLVEDDELVIEFVFNEAVEVDTTGGTPRVEMTLDSGTVFATYDSGSETNVLTFVYTIQDEDEAQEGPVLVSPIDLNDGTIVDADGEDDTLLVFGIPDLAAFPIDAVAPEIDSVTVEEDETNVDNPDPVTITVVYDEPVVVTVDEGAVVINLFENDGETPIGDAELTGGTGTDTLTFEYVVQEGDSEETGIKVGPDIILSGDAEIKDAAGNDAEIEFEQITTTLTLNDSE
jgi:hypothetical protein